MWYIQEGAPPDPNNRDIQIYKQDWILPDDVYGDMCLLVVRSPLFYALVFSHATAGVVDCCILQVIARCEKKGELHIKRGLV